MLKCLTKLALAVSLACCPLLLASGGGSGGGGGGGGGRTITVKYTGLITDIEYAPEGVYVTVGNLYYNTGTALVTNDTSVKIDNVNGSVDDLELGDTATLVVAYPSNVVTKVECISHP